MSTDITNKFIIKLYPWIIFTLGIIIFSLGVPSEYHVFYIARFGLFVKTMFHHGISFFNFQYGAPYPDYITGPTIISYLSSLVFGNVSVFSCSLPNIIISSLTLVFIYLIAAIHSRKWGMYAIIFALFTSDFYSNGHTLSPDAYITLITTICFYIAYTAKMYTYIIPILLILGFLFRGPIGLIIPAGVLCGFYLFSKNYKALLYFSITASILLILCFILLLDAAYYTGGKSFITQVLHGQESGRFTTDKIYYFLPRLSTIFCRYLPTSILSIITLLMLVKNKYFKQRPWKEETNLLIYLMVWVAIVFVGIAIVTLKKSRYFLPMAPALSLLSAYLFITVSKNLWISRIKSIFVTICYLLPWLILLSVISFWIYNHYSNYTQFKFAPLIISLIILSFITILIKIFCKNKSNKILLFICTGLLACILLNIYHPFDNRLNTTTSFMDKVQSYNLPIAFYKIGPDNFDVQLTADARSYFIPQFINNQNQLEKTAQKMIIITYKKNMKKLKHKIKILAYAKINGHDMMAFTLY